jgi:hypothetical protein
MMGMCVRTKNPLHLTLPSIVWKQLVNDTVTINDVLAVDVLSFQVLDQLKKLEEETKGDKAAFNEQVADISFTVRAADTSVVELVPGGASMYLNYDNKEDFEYRLTQYRINEYNVQVAALRRGLAQTIPMSAVSLFSWKELELRACGRGFTVKDVDLLEKMTNYSGHGKDDRVTRWFFEMLREWTDEQRGMFLTFVWGRSILPSCTADFESRFTISGKSCNPPDDYFPVGHTCGFSNDLPTYTTKEILVSRVTTAITLCSGIDGD